MAVIVVDEDKDGNPIEPAQPQPEQPPEPQPTAEQPAAEDLPEKFRGKSPADIAKAYQELETRLGRQANEIGELRKTHDEFIRSALARVNQPEPPKQEQDDDSEFFVNPRAAIKKLLQEDEVIKELRAHKAETQQERAVRVFREKHPDAKEIAADPQFQEWVMKSPVRQAMLVHADRNFDAAAGDELFSTWKELKAARGAGAPPPAADTADAARQQARDTQLKAGVMPTGSAAPDTSDGKKVYRRSDLVRMMISDPERYASMGDEILSAYAEGRVR